MVDLRTREARVVTLSEEEVAARRAEEEAFEASRPAREAAEREAELKRELAALDAASIRALREIALGVLGGRERLEGIEAEATQKRLLMGGRG